MSNTTNTSDREIVLTRTFDAPRELVFGAWTEPDQIENWWGPNGFTTTTHEMDFREGGTWRFLMHGPDGTDYPNEVTYIEIDEPTKLVYSHGSGEAGDSGHHVTVTFAEEDGKTRITMRMRFATVEAREGAVEFGAVEGGKQTLGRLAEHLAQLQEAQSTTD